MTHVYQRLAPFSSAEKFLRGDIIVSDPNRVDSLIYVVSGVVAVEFMNTDPETGRTQPQVILHQTRNEFLSIASYFNSKMKAPVRLLPTTYVADTDVYVAEVRYSTLNKALQGSLLPYADEIRDALTASMLTQAQHLMGRVSDLCTSSVMVKLKHALERRAATHGRLVGAQVQLDVNNQQQIAQMIGSSREAICRHFDTLHDSGWMVKDGKSITLLNTPAWVFDRINERETL